jgi:hypothetical protein
MLPIQEIERNGTAAVKRLRLKKLSNGLPFMINTKDLPGNQCYLEYPGGTIELVKIERSAKDFTVIRTLSSIEVTAIRKKYNLAHE